MGPGHRVCTDTSYMATIKVQIEERIDLSIWYCSNPLAKQGKSESEPLIHTIHKSSFQVG